VVIAHEQTPATRAALIDGEIDAVIALNVGHLVRSSLRVLRNLCDDLPIHEKIRARRKWIEKRYAQHLS
jgi:LacI family transcriptional regulator